MNIRKGVVFLLVSFSLMSCVSNEPFRDQLIIKDCVDATECKCSHEDKNCGASLIERYENFDLTFVEFTERGNFFNRTSSRYVFDFIHDERLLSDKGAEDGVAVVVFVHGWKHNAKSTDKNVVQFRSMLEQFASKEVFGKRRVVGVYVGWRGLSVTLPLVKELSFWERKSVAEEVGSGGVTEVLSRLNQLLITPPDKKRLASQQRGTDKVKIVDKNALLIIGHSFGGAIVLSALNDVYLNNLLKSSAKAEIVDGKRICGKVQKFADGVILLNPAIEANSGYLLKEAVANSGCDFKDQPKLMHVISSDGDMATKWAFPLGQYLDVAMTWDQKVLKFNLGDKPMEIREFQLDTQTVGNLEHFRTGYLSKAKDGKQWNYRRCDGDTEAQLKECAISDRQALKYHFPYVEESPLSFIKTDENFIENHNDIFNCEVQSYLTTIMHETQAVDHGGDRGLTSFMVSPLESQLHQFQPSQNKSQSVDSTCSVNSFDFSACFNKQLAVFCN